jgi:SAM-dependent methyltransferase
MERFARDWDILGERNPYGGILTGESGTLSDWDADAFFATGRADVDRFIDALPRFAVGVQRRSALDFGCGIGRISRSMAAHFRSVVGVDVAPAMIARARVLNAQIRNCEFVVNREPHLKRFETETFDVVYSRLVLQHISPSVVRGYIPELIRVLSPGGVLMFQLPEDIHALKLFLHAPVVGGRLKRSLPLTAVRAYRLLKYQYLSITSPPAMRMSGLPFQEVSTIVRDSGGSLLAAVPDGSHGAEAVAGFEYWVTKARHSKQ